MTAPSPPVVRDALDILLLARWRDMPRYRGRLRCVVEHVLDALAVGEDVETYAQARASFWYKVYFISPYGALKSDTTGEVCERTAFPRRVIHDRNLRRVPVGAVMENWHVGDLRERSRPLAGL